MKKTIRNFKGVWIPKNVWLDKDLTLIEKCFLVEVDSLDNENGCFASNAHFSEFFAISKGRCTQILKSLEKKEYIKITLIRNGKQVVKRVIRILNRVVNKLNNPSELIKQPYLENAQGNNTVINNSIEVSLLKKEIEKLKAELEKHNPKELKHEKEVIEIVNFLNEKTGKNFKAKSIKTIGLINGRLNEGYTIDDFKNVITNKANQWLNDKVTNTWLRPLTLFNVNKFEDYVNENPPAPVEVQEDDFQLNDLQEEVYQNWIEEGKQKYPALVNSKTIYLTRRHLADLMIYANKPTTRIEFTIKDFKIFMQKCFKELNDFKYKRDAYINAYNYIIDEARKEINR